MSREPLASAYFASAIPCSNMRSRDTSRAARAVQSEAQRRVGPAGRVELAIEMSEQARAISIEGVMAREPGLKPEEARARVLRRLLGDGLYDACWPTSTER